MTVYIVIEGGFDEGSPTDVNCFATRELAMGYAEACVKVLEKRDRVERQEPNAGEDFVMFWGSCSDYVVVHHVGVRS